MANETLTSVFSDIADAVRAKGVSGQMKPTEMSTKITSIPSGGETPEAEWKDVNFIDYDGKNLYSYTTAEALALTELPPAPDRTGEGLTFQEWNYSLSEMKANVNGIGKCIVGAVYLPTDGKTHIFITIPDASFANVRISYFHSSDFSSTIDWGDGSDIETFTSSTWVTPTHVYNPSSFPASYEIKLYSPAYIGFDRSMMSTTTLPNQWMRQSIIDKVYFSSTCSSDGINRATNLKKVVLGTAHQYNSSLNGVYMRDCSNIHGVVFPKWTTPEIGTGANSRTVISVPPKPSGYTGGYYFAEVFVDCTSIEHVCPSIDMSQIGNDDCFRGCIRLNEFDFPSGVYLTYAAGGFKNCYNLRRVSFGDTGSSGIPANFFDGCSGLIKVDFTRCTTLVPLSNTNAFQNTNSTFQIIVPDALYEDWIVATNWSTYASQIVKASEA